MLWQFFTRHPNNGRCRSVNFQTTHTPAFALDAADWDDAGVTNLAAGAVDATPKFSAENYSAANSGPQRQTDDRLTATSGAAPHFTNRRGVRIVFQREGAVKLRGQSLAHITIDNRWNVRRVNN